MLARSRNFKQLPCRRFISATCRRQELRDVAQLPDRVLPSYRETQQHDLLTLHWPSPPRNMLLLKKDFAPIVTESFVQYIRHVHASYPGTHPIVEPATAQELHEAFDFPLYTTLAGRADDAPRFDSKVDLVSTLGGDGTILRAASLFANSPTVPPVLSFGMGTLGFLGEWSFKEHKRALREVYVSGAEIRGGNHDMEPVRPVESSDVSPAGWSTIRGMHMGSSRNARVLLRNRLRVGVFDREGRQVNAQNHASEGSVYAMNEVILHRGRDPHLAIVELFVGGRFLTEAVADGMIVSTPTGSTAYSLSSGGSIVHPLVSSLLLTPICPRSLSFRPLVLPANTPITMRLSEKNRGRKVDISIDGVRRTEGLGVGMELRIHAEDVRDYEGNWVGGIPSIVRAHAGQTETGSEESWVGGLNRLLKFNYPMGED